MYEAATLDLTVDKGAVFDRTITWFNEDGTAHNLFGYSGHFVIQKGTATKLKKCDLQIAWPRAENIVLKLSPEETAELTQYVYTYGVFVKDQQGNTIKLLGGNLRVV